MDWLEAMSNPYVKNLYNNKLREDVEKYSR
jgi:hypothetical protein